jgi:hypothetical protein
VIATGKDTTAKEKLPKIQKENKQTMGTSTSQ